jgi:hypothetical protein
VDCTVKIGGEEITLPAIMNFATLERVWPALKALDDAPDVVGKVSCALAFLAAVLLKTRPELSLAVLKERLRVQRFDPQTNALLPGIDERPGVIAAVTALCIASGLVAKEEPKEKPEGEAEPPAAPGQEPAAATTAP